MPSPCKAIFVTGTGTDVGKTYVCRVLADSVSGFGKVTYFKPVQTGCIESAPATLRSPDLDVVMLGKATMVGGVSDHVPYCFTHACSPHLAAQLAGVTIDPAVICDAFVSLRERFDGFIIAEGAGGLMVPLTPMYFMIDLIVALGARVIVATTTGLGTLNHTLLTLAMLTQRGVDCAGLVCSDVSVASGAQEIAIRRDNEAFFRRFYPKLPVLRLSVGEGVTQKTVEFCHAIGF